MALHKLNLVGYVLDWTYDHQQERYDIQLAPNYTIDYAEKRVTQYIRKFDPHFSLEGSAASNQHFAYYWQQRGTANSDQLLLLALLCWIDDNVTYARRAAIANIYNLCQGKLTGGTVPDDAMMRNYINAFFTLGTSDNARINAIIQDSANTATWLDLFYEMQPGVGRCVRPLTEIATISAMIDRYRESYHNNPGLEAVNYIAKLLTGNYQEAGSLQALLQVIPGLQSKDASATLARDMLPVIAQGNASTREHFAAQALDIQPALALDIHKALHDAVSLEAIAQDVDARLTVLDVLVVESQ
jgi:hypothetical protein